MKLTRFLLVLSVVLLVYCVALLVLLLATMIPWVWLVFVGGGLVALYKKRRQLHAFGTARWAETRDLWARGMLGGGTGLIVGTVEDKTSVLAATKTLFDQSVPADQAVEQFLQNRRKPQRKLVRLNNAVHTAVFAPTGAGKGVSFVVPFLLTCPDSCVVVDLKAGELARLTSDARRRMGHRIVLLDPFKMVTQTPDTLNPLSGIDKDSPYAIDDCREIAAAMVDRKDEKGDGVHFLDNAEGGIAAICALLVQYAEGKLKSLQSVCDICSDPQSWQKAVQRLCESDAWDGCLASMGGYLSHLKERELASSMSTLARFLRFLSTPAIAASTRSSSFEPAELSDRHKRTTVYLVLPPQRASALSQLLRLWVGACLRGVIKGGLQEKNKVHFVCDEANILGKMDQISDALTIGRGFGIKMQLYYQDLGQLKKCWPDGQDQTLLANVSQVYFCVNDNETAKAVSERLGKATITTQSGGTGTSCQTSSQQGQGGGSSSYSSGRSNNANWQEAGRELLQPSEILNLSERIALVFTPGVRPIWTTMIRYYEVSLSPRPRKMWPAVKAFATAAFFLVAMGGLAVLLTLGIREKWQNEANYPVQTEQWQGERRPPMPIWFRQSNDNPVAPGDQGKIEYSPVAPERRQDK